MKRTARQSRPQLVCVLADNSASMRGEKAAAATNGIREMLLNCQTRGPRGTDRSYFRVVVVKFGDSAELLPNCNMTPVRQIDPESIEICGDGGGTNITGALEVAYDGLKRYLSEYVAEHAEREQHPVPLVVLFSDGRNGYGKPEPVAEKIKSLRIDDDPVVIAAAGVSVNEADKLDEGQLRRIASPECYLHISDVRVLGHFLSEVGSSGASSPSEVAQVIERVRRLRLIEG